MRNLFITLNQFLKLKLIQINMYKTSLKIYDKKLAEKAKEIAGKEYGSLNAMVNILIRKEVEKHSDSKL